MRPVAKVCGGCEFGNPWNERMDGQRTWAFCLKTVPSPLPALRSNGFMVRAAGEEVPPSCPRYMEQLVISQGVENT